MHLLRKTSSFVTDEAMRMECNKGSKDEIEVEAISDLDSPAWWPCYQQYSTGLQNACYLMDLLISNQAPFELRVHAAHLACEIAQRYTDMCWDMFNLSSCVTTQPVCSWQGSADTVYLAVIGRAAAGQIAPQLHKIRQQIRV